MSIYKGDRKVANECVSTTYLRNLHNPDWSQAVALTSNQLKSGYTAPKRGVFVGSTIPTQNHIFVHIYLNWNIVVGYGVDRGLDVRAAIVNIPVNKGDILAASTSTVSNDDYTIYFVPYKIQ